MAKSPYFRPLSKNRIACAALIIIANPCLDSLPSAADIIAPATQVGTAAQVTGIPEPLLQELEPSVAEKLQPLVMNFMGNRDQEALKAAYTKIAMGTDTLPNFDVFFAKLMVAYNQFAEALGVLERYTNENSEDPEAFLTLGSIAVANGRVVDAWLQFLYAQRLIDKDKLPAGRQSFVNPLLTELRASVAERRRQWAEAEQLFRKLQEMKPEATYPLWRAGRVKVMAGDVQAGFEVLQQAYERDNKLPYPSLVVAQVLHDTTDWLNNPKNATRVENWFKKAVSDTSDSPTVWASYFKWLILADRPTEVAHRYEQLADELKEEREIGLIRCVAARYENDLETAESILTQLHQANMEDLEVADQLALVLVESSDEAKRARALQLAERNARRAPQMEPIISSAAWIHFRLGSMDVAKQLFSQLASRGNLTPQTAYYMAEFMEKAGEKEESRRLLQMAADAPGLFAQRAQVKQRLAGK